MSDGPNEGCPRPAVTEEETAIASDLRAKIREAISTIPWEDPFHHEGAVDAVMEVLEDEGYVQPPSTWPRLTSKVERIEDRLTDVTFYYYDQEPLGFGGWPTPEELVGVKILDATGKVVGVVGPIIDRPSGSEARFQIGTEIRPPEEQS